MAENTLKLIPVYEEYMEYMIALIIKLPRTEKFSIGTEYKQIMYSGLEDIMLIPKIDEKRRLFYINKIDAKLNTQRVLLRIMYKYRWIDTHKFDVAMEKIGEVGKIIGGLVKYYAKKRRNIKCLKN